MATKPGDYSPRPEVGELLMVIHDFQARSSDELSLVKGDRVELIERDDEFGDGWFLGRHMTTGNSGLFPEVYTRLATRGLSLPMNTGPKASVGLPLTNTGASATTTTTSISTKTHTSQASPILPIPPVPAVPILAPSKADPSPLTLPLHSARNDSSRPGSNGSLLSRNSSLARPSSGTKLNQLDSQAKPSSQISHANQGSTPQNVLHETLTVIDEHMNDLKARPGPSISSAIDPNSEHSSPRPSRISYIQGEETDEEEEESHTREQVESWDADQVAEYLFTSGVEKPHCEVFRDQEISGEVLLGMDQSSLFLKAFDLGSVGRRLKTWQKIKNLQDEVDGIGLPTPKGFGGSDAGSEGSKTMRSRKNTMTGSGSQRLSSATNDGRPGSSAALQTIQAQAAAQQQDPSLPVGPTTSNKRTGRLRDSPTRQTHIQRPSAASVRELHHSRRHSSTDYRLPSTSSLMNGGSNSNGNGTTPSISTSSISSNPFSSNNHDSAAHKKQPSFDRNWTMGGASSNGDSPRPLSAGLRAATDDRPREEFPVAQSPEELDRGYFSSADVEGRKRKLFRKRDSLSTISQKATYTDEHRLRSATTIKRQSRIGSMDSVRDSLLNTAAQKYYGLSSGSHRRNTSTATTDSYRPVPPAKDTPSPTVTKLEGGEPKTALPPLPNSLKSKLPALPTLRAISDAVTGVERAKLAISQDGSTKDSPLQSPSRTGSSTPSAGPSFEIESPNIAGKSPLSVSTAESQRKPPKQKTKQETSAYQRGLLKITPKEAIATADFSGWMKKKSSHLMTTWKPRLFVLKGRRLSYFYSEEDTEEKGLIDISFHRVLPAENDRLTGLHATLTGATNSPMTPTDSSLFQPGADDVDVKDGDSIFIFKLMPPRAGLSKAVNFTKPTVHYFAVPSVKHGRMWMAAIMKATIDRDESGGTTTYQQKTISLTKARQMRLRPPALMNLDEKVKETASVSTKDDEDDKRNNGLGIMYGGEVDSAISGFGVQPHENGIAAAREDAVMEAGKGGEGVTFLSTPQSA